MSETTTLTAALPMGFHSGDYVIFTTQEGEDVTARVIVVGGATTVIIRAVHTWRWLEWLHARYEDVRWWIIDRWILFRSFLSSY